MTLSSITEPFTAAEAAVGRSCAAVGRSCGLRVYLGLCGLLLVLLCLLIARDSFRSLQILARAIFTQTFHMTNLSISYVENQKPQSKTKLYCSCSSSPSNFTTQHICLQRGGGGIPGKVVFGACPCGLTICPFLDTVSILLMVSESCKQKRRIVFNTWTAPWLCTVHCSTNNVWFILSQP